MGFFRNVFHHDGSMGIEHTVGNMRFDLNNPGAAPTVILSETGNMRSVVRPDGSLSQEWETGNMRFSSDNPSATTMLGSSFGDSASNGCNSGGSFGAGGGFDSSFGTGGNIGNAGGNNFPWQN